MQQAAKELQIENVEYNSKIYLCKSKFYMLVISLTQL